MRGIVSRGHAECRRRAAETTPTAPAKAAHTGKIRNNMNPATAPQNSISAMTRPTDQSSAAWSIRILRISMKSKRARRLSQKLKLLRRSLRNKVESPSSSAAFASPVCFTNPIQATATVMAASRKIAAKNASIDRISMRRFSSFSDPSRLRRWCAESHRWSEALARGWPHPEDCATPDVRVRPNRPAPGHLPSAAFVNNVTAGRFDP